MKGDCLIRETVLFLQEYVIGNREERRRKRREREKDKVRKEERKGRQGGGEGRLSDQRNCSLSTGIRNR